MTPHLNDEQVRCYRERSLAAADLLRASDHIAGCEMCRGRVAAPEELHNEVSRLQRVFAAEAGPVHLTYDEIAAYVDGQTSGDEAARVETHARACGSCASDLAELRVLRNQIAEGRSSRAPWPRVVEIWRGWLGWPGAFALAGAASVVLLVLVIPRTTRQDADFQARIEQPRPAPQSPAGPQIRDGNRVVALAGGGRLAGLETLPDPYRVTVERALAAGRVDPGKSLAGLSTNRGVLLGGAGETTEVDLLEPLGTVVESRTPLFRWEPAAGAEYRVSVYDPEYNPAAGSGWIQAPEWRASAALRRGVRYSWQLRIRRGGKEVLVPAAPAPEARFQVLGEAEEAEIARLKREWGDSHLVLGLVFARAGMLGEAELELGKLREQNPGSEEVAKLLASVQALRGGSARR